MGIQIIADAKKDRAGWLEARKGYLTSSDFYTWRGDTPKWWSDTRDDIITGKNANTQKEFPADVMVSIEHGSADEEHIQRKFGDEIGSEVEPVNTLVTNDRWPHLAASIDGYVWAPHKEGRYCFSQDKSSMRSIANKLKAVLPEGESAINEVKKSTSAGWSKGSISEWYLDQLQGQLHILEKDHLIIIAETVLRKGHRLFWNLTAHYVQREPFYEDVMDQLNEEFENVIAGT
jgi:hypothetical protein